MTINQILVLFVVLIPFTLRCEEELVVRLETDSQLVPITISPFVDKASGFSEEYHKQLEEVFHFDFDNNGMTTINHDKEVPSLYQIAVVLSEHKMHVTVQGEDQWAREVFLTGYISEDRRHIHQLADSIFEALFGARGIASTRILYTVKTEGSDVWEMDYDGGNPRQITKDGGYCVTPAYVPPQPNKAAGSFVYVSYQSGQPKIYAGSLEGGKGRPLLTLSGNQLMPTVSRQRDRIAFVCDVTGNPDLFIQDFNPNTGVIDKPRHLYTAQYSTQGTPTFSPDGTRIAFVSNKSGTPRIYVIKIPPPGTPLKEIQPTLISKFTKGNTAPSWSPDGTKIAYCAKTQGVRQIMVYDFLTGLERQLTEGARNKENPSWAPNSLHLVYNISDAKACDLFVINLKNPNAIKISSGIAEHRFPNWEPRTSP